MSDYVGKYRAAALAGINSYWDEIFELYGDSIKSPIERAFYYALIAETSGLTLRDNTPAHLLGYRSIFTGGRVHFTDPSGSTIDRLPWIAASPRPYGGPDEVTVYSQVHVGRRRADFVLVINCLGGESAALAIECDGHDYHDRSREQVMKDKARDREFVLAGLPTYRFSGSEIARDGRSCVAHALEFLDKTSRGSADKATG